MRLARMDRPRQPAGPGGRAGIRARGEIPFLHAVATNPAIALYQELGFRLRQKVAFTAARVRKPTDLVWATAGLRPVSGADFPKITIE
jgi:hypothetical protein